MQKEITTSNKILIVAGEASSALYAQRLLEHWRDQKIQVEAFGVGSLAMEKLGFRRIGKSEEMAVVGLQEVLKHYGAIRKVFYGLIQECQNKKPNVILLLDYPDFNFRLVKKLKDLNVPVVYYISPQLWAWRTGRIKLVQKFIDKMLVLFPFEKIFYEDHGVNVDFVGHPLLDEINSHFYDLEFIKEKRIAHNVSTEKIVIGLMPGSRDSEIAHHFRTQLGVARQLLRQNEQVEVSFFVAPSLSLENLKSKCPPDLRDKLVWVQDDPLDMICMADIILTASGTATLFVGLLEKPMLVMYKMKALSAFLAKRLVKNTPYFGMINLILQKEVAPEFFQNDANVDRLSQKIQNLIDHPEERESMRNELAQAKNLLGKKGATKRVSKILEEYFVK